jgi:hypothetical protein
MIGTMSHKVEPANLAEVADGFGSTPFLLYCGAGGSARVNHVVVDTIECRADGATVRCRGFGRGVPERTAAAAPLSLLWPARASDGFSLIADGVGRIDGDVLSVDVEGAVLHRPAPVDGAGACAPD